MTLIIGFSGRARTGKTTCCEAILYHAERKRELVKIYDIGDMIRREAIFLGRLPDVERCDMTRGQLEIMIDLGKEKRLIIQNYWVEKVLGQIEEDKAEVALCPNLRLPIEAQAFRDAGGYTVRCTRLNENGTVRISEDRPPNDITETALEFWPADFYLTTKEGHYALLGEQAITLYEYLKGLHHDDDDARES